MADQVVILLEQAAASFWTAAKALVWPAVFFALLAVLTKRRQVMAAARRAAGETRINLILHFFDAVFVLPLMAVLVTALDAGVARYGLALFSGDDWESLGVYGTLLAAIFIGDFVGYWRHRLEHAWWLWPTHAIHHSDTEMTWLTLSRFHPINRLTTVAIDTSALLILGFPAWAVVLNGLVRHYYGQLIHADLPWTYGKLRAVFVSPVMHRWHHVREIAGSGSNFATVFSVFDRAFGTYHMPGLCNTALGIGEDMDPGAAGQLLYPFRAWRRLAARALVESPRP